MLNYLYIENIAVIEKARIAFNGGLNILTGETGAGKSIIIDSINAVSGTRVSRDIIRSGAQRALISAVFSDFGGELRAMLAENGIAPEEDGSLIVERELRADGKSVCRVGGRPVTAAFLRELSEHLVSIQGQHESYELLSPDRHLSYIDAVANSDALREEYAAAYKELKSVGRELDRADMDEDEKQRRIDMLRYQINELEAAQVRRGEKQELTDRKNAILNSEAIAKAVMKAGSALRFGETNALSLIQEAAEALEKAGKHYKEFLPLSEKLRDIEYNLQDCAEETEKFSELTQVDPGELDKIEERLDLLYRLGLKYGDEENMVASLERFRTELDGIYLSDRRKEELSLAFENAKKKAVALAKQLSSVRKAAGDLFEKGVMRELAFLDMPNVVFKVHRERCPLNAMGCDDISFLISVNPGEELKPLSKVASGGELSRIMLAIKTVLSGNGDVDTLIFDEIDSGISGRAAQKVGQKLKEISRHVQTLCITHLAQIASLADTHYLIRKDTDGERTYTVVRELDDAGRIQEIARIIGGAEATDAMLKSAAEMIEKGRIADQ